MNYYKPLPDSLTIKKSNIEGLGLFAEENIEENTDLGLSHIFDTSFQDCHIRTPLGGFINHSNTPNCEFVDDYHFKRLKTKKIIKKGEELTALYTLYNPEYLS